MDGTEIKEVPQPPNFVSRSPGSLRGSCDSAVGGFFWAVESHSSGIEQRAPLALHRSHPIVGEPE